MVGPVQPQHPLPGSNPTPNVNSPGVTDPNATPAEQQLQTWVNYYVNGWTTSSGLQARVNWNRASPTDMQTCSEAIAYAMRLLAANPSLQFTLSVNGKPQSLGSQAVFNALYSYAQSKFDASGLMNWEIDGNGSVISAGSATDADCDMAFALIQARNAWGDNGPYNYTSQAQTMLDNIRKHDCYSGQGGQGAYQWSGAMILPGDGWGSAGQSNFDASYVDPSLWNAFNSFDKNAPSGFWTNLTSNCLTVIAGSADPTTGLMPDWCDQQNYGAAPNFPNNHTYSYDACRVPLRLAQYLNISTTDGIAAKIKPILTKLMNFFMQVAAPQGSLSDEGYSLDGKPLSSSTGSPAFDGPVATALSILLTDKLYPPQGGNYSYSQCYNFTTKLAGNITNYLNNQVNPYSQYGSTPYYDSVIGLLSMGAYETPPSPPFFR